MKKKDVLAAELWERCKLPPLREYLEEHAPYFDWTGLKAWIDAGHSVGLHTHTHPDCSRLDRLDLEAEFLGPARLLKARLGVPVISFSYPFGRRLASGLEADLFAKGEFEALFGIGGFCSFSQPLSRLERAGAEGPFLGWSVFGPLARRFHAGR